MLLRGFRGIMKLYEIFHAMDKSSMKVTLNLDQFFFFLNCFIIAPRKSL
jgi:hypothetical protein